MITFKRSVRNLLEGMELDEESDENVERLTKLRKTTGDHVAMGNKLINVARRIKLNARDKGFPETVRLNHSLNAITMEAYSEQAD